jgi:hypothetical protein
MYPAAHYYISDFQERKSHGFEWKLLMNISKMLENDRRRLRKAVNYQWDNSHSYILNACGKPVLQVQCYTQLFVLWNVSNGVQIFANDYVPDNLVEMLDKAGKNLTLCKCGRWIENNLVKHYSFAGGVCPRCYNPKIHLPPDTSGD